MENNHKNSSKLQNGFWQIRRIFLAHQTSKIAPFRHHPNKRVELHEHAATEIFFDKH